jgi:hypothetical protein
MEVVMKIQVDVEEDGAVVQTLECEADAQETIEELANRLANQLGTETDDVLSGLGANGTLFQRRQRIGECLQHGNRWRHRRTCLDVHFESENQIHRFSAHSRWYRVHQWGCKHFHIAHDACANLELRDGSPEGPALNEKTEIGSFTGCKTVWLIKPGPEPNGQHR